MQLLTANNNQFISQLLPTPCRLPAGYINESRPKSGYFFSSLMTLLGASCLFLLNYYQVLRDEGVVLDGSE